MPTIQQVAEAIKMIVRARKMGARLNGKSVCERLVQAWVNQPEVVLQPKESK